MKAGGREPPTTMHAVVTSLGYRPAYLELGLRELAERARRGVAMLSDCRACPRDCGVDRLAGRWAACKTGRYAVVGSHFPHFGEEDCLRGWNGSGTIFFAHCNLRCVFCQNYDISQGIRPGPDAASPAAPKAPAAAGSHAASGSPAAAGSHAAAGSPPADLARMMLELQERGCHNINFVTPEHLVPQILEALVEAVRSGLGLPIVYNTSAYDALESLRLLDGVVDIYMPDFKYWSPEQARTYLKAGDYPEAARAAIREMHRQVGPLVLDDDGLARRGVLLRHLVMPGGLQETRAILRWVRDALGPETYVNLMDQYRPAGAVGAGRYPEINRPPSRSEFLEARRFARDIGLRRLDERRPHPRPTSRLFRV
jgi:putative pyruvate formate lyase activating enzyme